MQQVLWAAFLLGDLLLVLLFVGGNAAYYVAPRHFWFLQLVAIAVPYLGFGMMGVAAGALLGRRWGLFALHLGLWLVSVVVGARAAPEKVGGTVAGDAAVTEEARALRVITFNARGESFKGAEDFRELLRTTRPHLFAFQESPVQSLEWTGQGRVLGGALPLLIGAGLFPAQATNDPYFRTAQPIFSRLDPAGAARVLAGHPQGGLWESGGVNRAVYEWQGRPIAVYSVHLRSFSSERPWQGSGRAKRLVSPSAWLDAFRAYRVDFQVRAEQVRRLREMIEGEPYPFIVCGDLNSTPNNWVYGHLAGRLQDAFRQAGKGWGGTYHARLPLFRIDFIFASEEWEVRSAHVVRAIASDHFAVTAELILRPRSEPR